MMMTGKGERGATESHLWWPFRTWAEGTASRVKQSFLCHAASFHSFLCPGSTGLAESRVLRLWVKADKSSLLLSLSSLCCLSTVGY